MDIHHFSRENYIKSCDCHALVSQHVHKTRIQSLLLWKDGKYSPTRVFYSKLSQQAIPPYRVVCCGIAPYYKRVYNFSICSGNRFKTFLFSMCVWCMCVFSIFSLILLRKKKSLVLSSFLLSFENMFYQ